MALCGHVGVKALNLNPGFRVQGLNPGLGS